MIKRKSYCRINLKTQRRRTKNCQMSLCNKNQSLEENKHYLSNRLNFKLKKLKTCKNSQMNLQKQVKKNSECIRRMFRKNLSSKLIESQLRKNYGKTSMNRKEEL